MDVNCWSNEATNLVVTVFAVSNGPLAPRAPEPPTLQDGIILCLEKINRTSAREEKL